jgi:hypothetical protein
MSINIYQPKPITYKQKGVDINDRYVMEKNWTIQHDGFGLVTMQVKYTADSDKSYDITTDFKRGDPPPIEGLEYLTLHRVSASTNNGTVTVACEYCGIEDGASNTVTQVQVSSATAMEAIETHPNFTKVQIKQIGNGKPLAGAAKYIAENETDLTKNPNRAHFAITQPTALQAVQYSFAGFLPAQNPADDVNLKAGVRSYFRPSIILRCLVYTDSESEAKKTLSRVGWINYGWIGAINLPDPYANLAANYDTELTAELPAGVSYDRRRNYLCTNASMEIFGGLYKVQADLMLSGIIGWDPDIYPVDPNLPSSLG